MFGVLAEELSRIDGQTQIEEVVENGEAVVRNQTKQTNEEVLSHIDLSQQLGGSCNKKAGAQGSPIQRMKLRKIRAYAARSTSGKMEKRVMGLFAYRFGSYEYGRQHTLPL